MAKPLLGPSFMHQPDDAFTIAHTTTQLPSCALLDSVDLDEVNRVMTNVLSEHRLRVHGPASHFRARVRDCGIGDLRLTYLRYGTSFAVDAQPLQKYAVNFIINGSSHGRHGDTRVSAVSGQATVFSPFARSQVTWSPNAEVLSLLVPRTAVEDHFCRLSGHVAREIVFEPLVGATCGHLLRSAIGSALQSSAGGLKDLPAAVSWQIRDAILTAMLLELPHGHSELLTTSRAAWSRSRQLCDSATALMRRHLTDPPPIPKIAAALGVSERSLETTFRQELNTTPSAKFKRLRLEAVHEALQRLTPDVATVMQVAADFGGFYHPGRFASEYHKVFDEQPSKTLRRDPQWGPGSLTNAAPTTALRKAN